MPPKKIALISDAWDPQVNGVVTTFKNIIPLLNKKGFDVEVLHPEMFSNFSYPWYKEIKFSYNTKNITNDFFTKYDPDIIHLITEGPVGFAGKKISLQKNLKVTSSFHTRFPDYIKQRFFIPRTLTYSILKRPACLRYGMPKMRSHISKEDLPKRALCGHRFLRL